MIASMRLCIFLCIGHAAVALVRNAEDAELSTALAQWTKTGMRPDVAARLLGEVELKWVHGKLGSLLGDADEGSEKRKMVVSCKKVASAIVQGAAGDPAKVTEYMQDVCGRSKQVGYDAPLCAEFAQGCEAFLSEDVEYNRDLLQFDSFCTSFYEGAVAEAAKQWQRLIDQPAANKTEEHVTSSEAAEVVTTSDAPKVTPVEAEATTTLEVAQAANVTDDNVSHGLAQVTSEANSTNASEWRIVANTKAKLEAGRQKVYKKLYGIKKTA